MEDIWRDYEWLSFKEAAEFLGVEEKIIRRWVKDRSLVALPNPADAKLRVLRDFLLKRDDYVGPIESLRGTLILLQDGGLDDHESVRWLLSPDESLGSTPLAALLDGRKTKVRQIAAAQAL